jgi:hypothetical protein
MNKDIRTLDNPGQIATQNEELWHYYKNFQETIDFVRTTSGLFLCKELEMNISTLQEQIKKWNMVFQSDWWETW